MSGEENLANGEVEDHENDMTVDLQVVVCNICGEDHDTESCDVVSGLVQIKDSKIVSRALQTLPKNLEVKMLVDGTTSVITNVKIDQGTQFGPFQAPLSLDLSPSVLFPLKVFGKTFDEGYYLDTSDEEFCNWMCLVAPAANNKEQNLICYDMKQSIYFATTRDVQPGEELRVWYALYYGLKLQALPLADEFTSEEQAVYDSEIGEDKGKLKLNRREDFLRNDLLQTLAQHLPAHVLGAPGDRDLWMCKLCGVQEKNVASYARHLMTHYHQPLHHNLHAQCRLCLKHFFTKKALDKHLSRIHNSCENQSKVLPLTMTSVNTVHNGEQCQSLLPKVKSLNTGKLKMKIQDLSCEENCMSSGLDKAGEKGSTNDSLNVCDFSECDPEDSNKKVSSSSSLKTTLSEACHSTDNSAATSETFCEYLAGAKGSLTLCIEPNSTGQKKFDQDAFHPSDQTREDSIAGGNFQKKQEDRIIDSSSCGKFSAASFMFGEAKDIDDRLDNDDSMQFIVLEHSDGCEGSLPAIDKNANTDHDSTLHPTCDGSSILPQNTSESSVISSQLTSLDLTSPFTCDICQKPFQKCSYLYRHLRKHTGEFTCVTCLAVFARKENLKTHSCSHPKKWFACSICGKKFSAKKYLQRHIPMHTGEFTCSDCKRLFVSRLSLKLHRCSHKKSTSLKSAVACVLCKEVFDSEEQLKVHLKVHSCVSADVNKTSPSRSRQFKSQVINRQSKDDLNLKSSESARETIFICEVCGATFRSSSSMKTHMFCHGERKFECEVCKKRFHRKDVLQEHLRVHQEANFPCLLCGKKYKTKKSLYVHSLIHGGLKRFSCGVCGKRFFQKGNLYKHVQTHTSERTYSCQYCEKTFSSKEYFHIHELTHTQGKIHHCGDCQRSFVKKHLLDAHRQLFHSNRGFLCKFCNTVIRHRHSVRRHLEKCHSEHSEKWSLPGFIDQLLAEIPPSLMQPSGDSKTTPKQQQERQQVLESLRSKHFQKIYESTADQETASGSSFVYSPISVRAHSSNISQDPSVMFPSQEAFVDNTLPEYDQSQSSTIASQSLMISGNIQASEGEILLTLVDQDTLNNSSLEDSASVLTGASLGTDVIGLDSGTTFLMEDGNESGTNSILLYVVETSNGGEGAGEDIVWHSGVVKEQ